MTEEKPKEVVKERWPGGWRQDWSRPGIIHYAPRLISPGETMKFNPETDTFISDWIIQDLLTFLKENKQIGDGDRTEDLKIVHRLLDIVENNPRGTHDKEKT